MIIDAIRKYVGSVKFTTFLVSILTPAFAILAQRTGIITPNEVIIWVAGIIASGTGFILAQGWADRGKEASKINLETAVTRLDAAKMLNEVAKNNATSPTT